MSAAPHGDPIEAIRAEARRLGFFRMGVAKARPLPSSDLLDHWLALEMNGAMQYMARQAAKRKDPKLVFANARTILVLAMNYYTEGDLTPQAERGRISRYAWGDDYHQLVLGRLRQLEAFIRLRLPGVRMLVYVDTGPIAEKAWGALTSLGWQGKHSNLITRAKGSWFFVGVILIDRELASDVPEKNFCGTCSRCIPACPTGAIVAPYVVDARLCISYLTIEHRGIIPRPLRPLIGNRIFGCDDCQEVCPWNRFAAASPEGAFKPRAANLMPELSSLVDLSVDEFRVRFQGTPILRAKRDGFVRNVVVALGNSRRPQALDPLDRALRDTSPIVRAHAVWAVSQLGCAEAAELLSVARARESDPLVFGEFGPPEAVPS